MNLTLRNIKNLLKGRRKTIDVPITVPELERLLTRLSHRISINIEYHPEYKDLGYPIRGANVQRAIRFLKDKFKRIGENDVVEVQQQVYQREKSQIYYFDLVRKDARDDEIYRRATIYYEITIRR